MAAEDEKKVLHDYLRTARESLLWKLDGLDDYGVRRPMTRTGTNLLGIVKHVASVEAWYLGDCVGRPFPQQFPWFADDAEPNADMWATDDEPTADIIDLYRRVWAHSDASIEALPLDASASVPWWPPERRTTTFHELIVRMVGETNRHAGHADILRELIDGQAGYRAGSTNLPEEDEQWWAAYVERLERTARAVGDKRAT
jgi:hypothetical protein